jgi:hypothetical protein
MFWFDKQHPDTIFGDIRSERHTLCDGRSLSISPDQEMDFRELPFSDGEFKLVVFDPPHLVRAGSKSWLRAKYGVLDPVTWKEDIRRGLAECFRVLADDGVLIFKWNQVQIRTSEVLALTERKPLFGHPSGKNSGTHWICFMKTRLIESEGRP